MNYEYLTLKEEKLKLEVDNLKLKKENLKLRQINDQLLPTNNIKIREENKEQEPKIIKPDFDIYHNQLTMNDSLENELKEKNQHILKLKNKIVRLKAQYNQKIDEFVLKNKENEATIERLQSDIPQIIKQISESQNNESKISRENDQLKEKIKTQKILYKKKIIELTQLNEQNESIIKSLNEQIDHIKSQTDLIEQQKEEEMKIDNLLLYNQTKNFSLQSQLLIEKKEERIQILEEEISNLKKQQSSSLHKKDQMYQQMEELNNKNQALISQYEGQIKDLIKQNDELKMKILQQQTKNDQIDQLNQKVQELNDKNKALKIQFKEKLKEKELKIQSFENSHQQSNEQIDQINQQIRELNIKNESLINQYEDQLKELMNKNNEKDYKIKAFEITQQQSIEQINQLNQRIIKQHKKIQSLKSQCIEKVNEITRQTSEKVTKIKTTDSQNNQQSRDEINIYKHRIKELMDKNEDLKQKFKLLQNQFNIQNNQFHQVIVDHKTKKGVIDEKERLINDLKIIINRNQDEINRMKSELANLNKQKKLFERNNKKIIDLIYSYKQQNFEMDDLIKIIEKSENGIILSDSDEKFSDSDENKSNEKNDEKLIENLNEKVEKLKAKLTKSKENVQNEKNKNLELNEKIKKLEKNNKEINDQDQSIIYQLKNEIKEKELKIEELNKSILIIQNENNKNQNEESSLLLKLPKEIENNNEQRNEIEDLKNQILIMQNKHKEILEKLNEEQNNQNEDMFEPTSLAPNANIENNEKMTKEIYDEQSKRNENLNKQTSTMENVNIESQNEYNENIEKLEIDRANFESQIERNEILAQLAKEKAIYEEQKKIIEELKQVIVKLKSELQNYEELNNQKDEQIEQLNNELHNKQTVEKDVNITLEITDETKQKIDQINSLNLNDNDNKYESDIHTFRMCIDNRPICIAIGDIEGDIEKLRPIYNLIKSNPMLNFIFIGDLFDDISDNYEYSNENFECLSLLSEFFIPEDRISFKLDHVVDSEEANKVSLPSSFKNIVFKEEDFDNIENRVKFIAGNSECDTLMDLKSKSKNDKSNPDSYCFGKKQWKKSISFKNMCLLYRYFKSCFGIITMKNKEVNKTDMIDTIIFRHSPDLMKKYKNDIIIQNPSQKIIDSSNKFIFVTGHSRKFGLSNSSNPKAPAYIVDTSTNDYKRKKDKKEQIRVRNDKRLAVISKNEEKGFEIKAFSLPYDFNKV